MATRVTLIEGDGIGPEVTGATVRIREAAGAEVDWQPRNRDIPDGRPGIRDWKYQRGSKNG